MVEHARWKCAATSGTPQLPLNMSIAIFRSSIVIFGPRRAFCDNSWPNRCGAALVVGILRSCCYWCSYGGGAKRAKLLTRDCRTEAENIRRELCTHIEKNKNWTPFLPVFLATPLHSCKPSLVPRAHASHVANYNWSVHMLASYRAHSTEDYFSLS